MIRVDRNTTTTKPPLRQQSKSSHGGGGRDSPPTSDASSPGNSTSSTTTGSLSSSSLKAMDESYSKKSTSRQRQRPHATTAVRKKKYNVIRIVSQVPNNAKSLQELDEIVGCGTGGSSSRLEERVAASPQRISEDEYYYDDDSLLDQQQQQEQQQLPVTIIQQQQQQQPKQLPTTTSRQAVQPKEATTVSLEEIKVVQHLMRPSPHAADMQSVWSTRSQTSSKSLRRKRGSSLEREISRTILQTAVAGEAGAAHFLVDGDAKKNGSATPLATCSAQFILTDLFYEAARQKMEDALPDPSLGSDEASCSSRNFDTADKNDVSGVSLDGPWFPGITLSNWDDTAQAIDDEPISSSEDQWALVSPKLSKPPQRREPNLKSASMSGPVMNNDGGIASHGGFDARPPIAQKQTQPRDLELFGFHNEEGGFPPSNNSFSHGLGRTTSAQNQGQLSSLAAIHGNVKLNKEATENISGSWVSFGSAESRPKLSERETSPRSGTKADRAKATENAVNYQHEDVRHSSSRSLSSQRVKKPVLVRKSSLPPARASSKINRGDSDPAVGVDKVPKAAATPERTMNPRTKSRVETGEDLFKGLDTSVSTSWADFDNQFERNSSSIKSNLSQTEGNIAKVNTTEGGGRATTGVESWSADERALYSHPTIDVRLSHGPLPPEKVDPMNSSFSRKALKTDSPLEGDASLFDGGGDDCSTWTSFDDAPSSRIFNPFKNPTKAKTAESTAAGTKATKIDAAAATTIKTPIHYSPNSVFDVEKLRKRAVAINGPKL